LLSCLARALAVLALAAIALLQSSSGGADPARRPATPDERTGSFYGPPPALPLEAAPPTRELTLPPFRSATAIWGSTGRDLQGRIWIGVSAGSSGMSAHLIQYDPEADVLKDRGSVVEQLKAAGLHRAGEGQIKIHTRLITADDGWLYFASTDEDGEVEDGTVLPRWGGHFWRVDPDAGIWQHLWAAPEGLVAAAGVGRYVYVLGYWNHVLFQHDTSTGAMKRVVVGSVGGHVSRNFLADANGHAYVPRVTRQGKAVSAALVEYDADLKEVGATPLEQYNGPGWAISENHGITGLTYLADGRLAFTTHRGGLYLIEPQANGPAKVTAVGWFHPQGPTYSPSLYCLDGRRYRAGVTQKGRRFDWVVFDLQAKKSTAQQLDTKGLKNVLLYGSTARDNAGRFYVGGWTTSPADVERPFLLQVGR
jgi:hypothetical protein